jgi:ubiquitin carboxyl-terminal hydrolase 5/13
MRLDEALAAHLAALGIDVSAEVKTGKTLADLQLELNKNMNWSAVLEADGKEAELRFGRGFCGLSNLGNSCYLNRSVGMHTHT